MVEFMIETNDDFWIDPLELYVCCLLHVSNENFMYSFPMRLKAAT